MAGASLAGAPQEQLFTTMAITSAYTAPIFGWLVVHKMAQAAAVLGREEDAVRYQEEADQDETRDPGSTYYGRRCFKV